MSMVEAITSVFANYVTFSGRARRSEYWFFKLFVFLGSLVLTFPSAFISHVEGGANIMSTIWVNWRLAILIPSLAVGVRRLHDIGKSGWFLLLNLIPVVGTIIVIVFMATDSQPGTNQYGPNPKGM